MEHFTAHKIETMDDYQPDDDLRQLVEAMSMFVAGVEQGNRLDFQREVPPVYSSKLPSSSINRNEYRMLYEESKRYGGSEGSTTVLRPAVEHGMAPSLETLKPTTLRGVAKCVNRIHDDRVLFVKTTTYEPCRAPDAGTFVLVEDTKGDCLMLNLFNFVQPDEDPREILPVNTYLALLAPYMHHIKDNPNRNLTLRCDNPQCVVVFDSQEAWQAARKGKPQPPEKTSPLQLVNNGNVLFARGKMTAALTFYSRALASPNIQKEDRIRALSNRAELFIRRRQWENARSDATEVLVIDSNHKKAKFRLAKALMHIGKASEAKEVCRATLEIEPNEKHFLNLSESCQRVSEEQNGNYDIATMIKESDSKRPMPFHGDYLSPSILTGVDIERPGTGVYRGCKAANDIEEGVLLSASKAFAYVAPAIGNDNKHFNPYSNETEPSRSLRLLSETVGCLWRRPQLGRTLYSLSAGSNFPKIPDSDVEKVDIPRIRCLLRTNAFSTGIDRTLLDSEWRRGKDEMRGEPKATESEFRGPASDISNGSAIWVQESFYNHSCTPNCSSTQIGDHIFIRTTKPVSKGEELCIAYISLDYSYKVCKEKFAKWTGRGDGFICACDWCLLLRSNRRLRVMEEEVVGAFNNVVEIAKTQPHIPMDMAANKAISATRRQEIFQAFSHLELPLQNRAVRHLKILEGMLLNHCGDTSSACAAFEEAAAITYAVEGAKDSYAYDMWRVVGPALDNNQVERAVKVLQKIWNLPAFDMFPSGEARDAFVYLTILNSFPLLDEEFDDAREQQLRLLAWKVSSEPRKKC